VAKVRLLLVEWCSNRKVPSGRSAHRWVADAAVKSRHEKSQGGGSPWLSLRLAVVVTRASTAMAMLATYTASLRCAFTVIGEVPSRVLAAFATGFRCCFPVIGKVAWVVLCSTTLVATVALIVSHDLSPHVGSHTGKSVFNFRRHLGGLSLKRISLGLTKRTKGLFPRLVAHESTNALLVRAADSAALAT
jgi:hypothetical protein